MRFDAATAWYLTLAFMTLLIRPTTIMVFVLSLSFTYLCIVYKLITDLPITLLSVGIIFPISYGVQNTIKYVTMSIVNVAWSLIDFFHL